MIKINPAMKKTFGLILFSAAACVLQSCMGDHSANNSQDTVRKIMSDYDARKIAVDTATVTTTTGSASLLESTGSGGKTTVKDTVKHTYYAGKPATPAAAGTIADTSKAATAKKDTTAKK
jgi:UDP-N-acetylmuramyl pentapeptide synthase